MQSPHFDIYSETSDDSTRAILGRFEQLRAFFEQPGWSASSAPPSSRVRVILFASAQDYEPYRIRSTADAYSVEAGEQDYIVMAGGDVKSFRVAAHEYAHLVMRASGGKLPPWLQEGLAEFYSTLHIGAHGTELGGPLAARLQSLRHRPWMPLAALTGLTEEGFEHQERTANDLFYAESWALTGMLAMSPSYAAQFPKFVAAVSTGAPALALLTTIYQRSEDQIGRDLRSWAAQGATGTVQLPPVRPESFAVQISDVAPLAARLVLAQLLLTAEEFDRAEALFSELNREAPDSAEAAAGLGVIALHKGDADGARRAWKRAIDLGISEAKLCFQYAVLADEAGLSPEDIRPALQRAVALDPQFDDARYQLALLEKNAGHYEAALRQFQAMRVIPAARAYAYSLALADTYNELGRRDEAQSASQHAALLAITASERAPAEEETYIADTDIWGAICSRCNWAPDFDHRADETRRDGLESVHRTK